MQHNSNHKGHRSRLRSKFLDSADFLENHELIELLMFYAIPRSNTNEIAHNILNQFGNLADAFDSDSDSIRNISGIGDSAACFFGFISNLCSHMHKLSKNDNYLYESFISEYFRKSDSDAYAVLGIDADGKISAVCDIPAECLYSKDSLLRKTTEIILVNRLEKVIVAHYSEDFESSPSESEFGFLKNLADILSVLKIGLTDYMVCDKNSSVYSAEKSGSFSFESSGDFHG